MQESGNSRNVGRAAVWASALLIAAGWAVMTGPSRRVDGAPLTSDDRVLANAPAARPAEPGVRPALPIPGAGRYATDPAQLSEPTVVSTAWLEARLGRVIPIDVRDEASLRLRGGIPGSVRISHRDVRSLDGGLPHMLLPAEILAARLGAAGIGPETEVVVYGDEKLKDVTFVALACVFAGHEKVAILEGGFPAWSYEGRPCVHEPARPRMPQIHPARATDAVRAIETDEVAQRVRDRLAKVLDVRSSEQYCAEHSVGDGKPGHIPGALNRPASKEIVATRQGAGWKPKEALEADLRALGIGAEDPVIVSCRTGHAASESYFVLRFLLGNRNARWYNGSFSAWSAREDLPVEVGPGAAPSSAAKPPATAKEPAKAPAAPKAPTAKEPAPAAPEPAPRTPSPVY